MGDLPEREQVQQAQVTSDADAISMPATTTTTSTTTTTNTVAMTTAVFPAMITRLPSLVRLMGASSKVAPMVLSPIGTATSTAASPTTTAATTSPAASPSRPSIPKLAPMTPRLSALKSDVPRDGEVRRSWPLILTSTTPTPIHREASAIVGTRHRESNLSSVRECTTTYGPTDPRSSVGSVAVLSSARRGGRCGRVCGVCWSYLYDLGHRAIEKIAAIVPVLDPESTPMLVWDLVIILIVLYSTIIVPIEVGFPYIELGTALHVISIATDALFVLDVLHNFCLGFYLYDDDKLIKDRVRIAKRYLSGWFLLDILAILPTEYFIKTSSVSSASAGSSSSTSITNIQDKSVMSLKLARLIRFARITKLARLIKLRHFAAKVENVLELDAVITRLSQLLCQVLLVTHLVSCFWHFLACTRDEGEITWLTVAGIENASNGVQYLYSLYWAATTLATVGYGDIRAVTTAERCFAMITSIIGAAGFGFLIGNMTKILENWNRQTTSRIRKLSMVQTFVRKKAIPKQLQSDLLRYFRHYIAQTSAFDERELLLELSLSLRDDVLRETSGAMFFCIPALKRLPTEFVMDMSMYVKPLIAVKGDILAREHSVGTEMFILNHGMVEVQRTAEQVLPSSPSSPQQPPQRQPSKKHTRRSQQSTTEAEAAGDADSTTTSWIVVLEILTTPSIFGESSLLNYTLHSNSYTARSACDLYTLPKEDFDRLIEDFPDVEPALLAYHKEHSALYDRVYAQTIARYQAAMVEAAASASTQGRQEGSNVASEARGAMGAIYPTLNVLVDGVLQTYRTVPLQILEKMTLEISMGISVFNSDGEKKRMLALITQRDRIGLWRLLRSKICTIVHPEHPMRMRWDFVIAVLLIYCAAAIPYDIAFGSDQASDGSDARNPILKHIDTAMTIIFAVDIVVNFRTAIVDPMGRTEYSAKRVAIAYLRLWFWVDLISTLPIAEIAATVAERNVPTLHLIRTIRLLKLSRLLKLVRTGARLGSMATHYSTWRILRLLFKMLLIAHLLACGLYYVALSTSDRFHESVLQLIPETATSIDKYVFSLYWAVTTMTTVGYGDTAPANDIEVAYVTCGLLIGASMFTYMIGTLSSIVEEMHVRADHNRERMDRLNAYLKERGISKSLSIRLRRYYEYALSQRDDEDEDQILSALSDNLRSQLILHLNRDVVSKIKFFAEQDDFCVSYLISILDPEFCLPGEFVFMEGQVGRHMYFLVKGVSEVLFHANTSREFCYGLLGEGDYFGEIAMLTQSKRAASIRARSLLSLFALSRSGLDRISQHYPEIASNLIEQFKTKIKELKKTSLRHLGTLVQEDVRLARRHSGLLSTAVEAELGSTLEELEEIVSRVVRIYGGGDKGKRKALACVMQHLRKYEFSLNDFLQAAEESATFNEVTRTTGSHCGAMPKLSYSAMVIKRLQQHMRRRSSFS